MPKRRFTIGYKRRNGGPSKLEGLNALKIVKRIDKGLRRHIDASVSSFGGGEGGL